MEIIEAYKYENLIKWLLTFITYNYSYRDPFYKPNTYETGPHTLSSKGAFENIMSEYALYFQHKENDFIYKVRLSPDNTVFRNAKTVAKKIIEYAKENIDACNKTIFVNAGCFGHSDFIEESIRKGKMLVYSLMINEDYFARQLTYGGVFAKNKQYLTSKPVDELVDKYCKPL